MDRAVAGFAASSGLACSVRGSAGEASTLGRAEVVTGSASVLRQDRRGLEHFDIDRRDGALLAEDPAA